MVSDERRQSHEEIAVFAKAMLKRAVQESFDSMSWEEIRGKVREQLSYASYGQHDADWLAFYSFFDEVCHLEAPAKLRGLFKVAQNAGWWWPMRNAVILSERHNTLHRDDQGRLHCDDGPALGYPDDWGVWEIHGVRLPRHVVEHPETITAREIKDEQNVEVRRVMLERFGFERYMRETGGKQVQEDKYGKLWRTEVTNDEPLVMVEVVNATPESDGSFRHYMLRVPPNTRTAHEGVAWTFGFSKASDYHPIVET